MSSFQSIVSKTNRRLSKKVANNTYAELRLLSNGVARAPLSVQDWEDYPETHRAVAIRLHKTDVVTYTGDGRLLLSTGGWKTMTTKARINDFTPTGVNVYSLKGDWRVYYSGGPYGPTPQAAKSIPFVDGVTLEINSLVGIAWTPVEGTYPTETQERLAQEAKKKLRSDIKAYLKQAERSLTAWATTLRETGTLSTSGDCLYCKGIVTTMDGAVADDNGHLWAHLRDGYVFPSLFINAYADRGFAVPAHVFSSDLSYSHDRALKLLNTFLDKRLSASAEPQTNTALLAHYLEQAKDVLEKPSDFGYFGGDDALWFSSAPTWTKHRDSSNEDLANFEVVWSTLKTEFPDLFPADLDEDGNVARDFNHWPAIYVFGAGHWAVGHIDQIVVPVLADPTSPLAADNLHPAFIRVCEFGGQVKSYPLLDGAEDILARLDHEQAQSEIRQYLVDPTDEQVNIVYRAVMEERDGEWPEWLDAEEWVRIIDGIVPSVGLVLQDWAASRRAEVDADS